MAEEHEKIVLDKWMVKKYGFPRALVLKAIGEGGYKGSVRGLARKTEFVSEEYMKNLVCAMVREGLIRRIQIKRGIYSFMVGKI